MAKKIKTVLLSKNEIKRDVFLRLEHKDKISGLAIEIINKYLMDSLSIAIVNHMLHEECYEFNDYCANEINYNHNDGSCNEEDLITSNGEFNPLDYDDVYDFLSSSDTDYDVIYNWGKPYYSQKSIEHLILDNMEEDFIYKRDDLINELKSHGKSIIKDFMDLIENISITYDETRKVKSTGNIIHQNSVNVVKNKKTEIPQEYLNSVNIDEMLEEGLEFLDDDSISEYLCQEFIEDVNMTSFKEVYLRGCELLGYEDNYYKTISYSNTENEEFIYNTLKKSVDNNMILDSLGLPAKASSINYKYFKNKFADCGFNENFSIDNSNRIINDAKAYIRNKIISNKTDLKDCEEYLKLLAAIYSYEIGEIQLLKLKEVFQYEFLRNTLLDTGIKDATGILYRKCKTQDSIKKVLPREPKDYYPNARKLNRKFILHVGPTNSGKTYESLEKLRNAESGVYLAPLRLLALEVQEKMKESGCKCSLLTGEEEELIENSKHICCTIEKLNFSEKYQVAIIDECQMIEEPQRGAAWTSAILGVCAEEIHVCMAPYAEDLVKELINYCGDTYEIVNHYRDTELIVEKKNFNFISELQKGDAIVAFSKRKVLNIAAAINTKTNMTCSVLFGALPYKSRKKQFQNFSEGISDVLITTDCVGLGVNLAIKRIIFKEDNKFDGTNMRKLRTSEILQIAGRAGRKNIYDEGYVVIPNKNMINEYNKEIEPLNTAYLGLTHHICEVDGDLSDILSAWEQIDFRMPFIKADIRNQKKILDDIKDIELRKEDQYKAIFLPVNPDSYYETGLLKNYLENVAENGNKINFPQPPSIEYGDKLKQLEEYSKAIDLYYSVCKAYGLELDFEMVNREREVTCNEINKLLLSDKLEVPRCNCCGKELAWDYSRYRCESCYSGYNRNRYYENYDEDYWDDDDEWDDDF